ncbi:MAG: hypothetical protein ACXWZM_10425 [Solirubrobacterales bacterium]
MFTLPSVSYLAALHELDNLNYGTVPTIVVILGFNAMLLILLEVPLFGYLVAPERTVVEGPTLQGLAQPKRPPDGDLRRRRHRRPAGCPRCARAEILAAGGPIKDVAAESAS